MFLELLIGNNFMKVMVMVMSEELFYLKCWREMQNFLAEVVRDQSDDFPFASDVLRLMRSIERKFEVQV